MAAVQDGDGAPPERPAVPVRTRQAEGIRQHQEVGPAAILVSERGTPPDDLLALIELVGELDPNAMEALRVEIRQLAKRHGVDIKTIRVERATPG